MSPEDVILYKLEWYQIGKSEKHLRDVSSMLHVMGDELDVAYIQTWAAEVNSTELWAEMYTVYRGS